MKIFLLVWSVSAFFTPAFGSVGFQQLSVPDPPGKALSVAVWFPSVGKPVSVTGAGHYAFLPPCSETLAKQAPRICTDDPSFDRHAFHRDFNREVVAFFKRALAA
jgi:hypothetical protein